MKYSLSIPSQPAMRSGVYVGGIGSGGFEVRPDGRFHCRQLFNEWRAHKIWDAIFFHRDETGTRVLCGTDLCPTGERIAGVNAIDYAGEFPYVTLRFPDRNVSVSFESFFIPGDVKNSSLPAAIMRVKGRGKLAFLVPGIYKAKAVRGNRSVILRGAEGELGVSCLRGTIDAVPQHQRYNVMIGMAGKRLFYPQTAHDDRPEDLYCKIQWEGTFDDEVTIAWHFPHSLDHDGNLMGHYYANFFDSCSEVMTYVRKNLRQLRSKTAAFHASVYQAAAPVSLRESYGAQVSAFVKQSRLAKDGTFGVWEGSCCCCGLQTTDVAHYGSWMYARLFPELEKSALRLTRRLQRKDDGWIPHDFPGTFYRIDEYRRKDMNMQFALMVYRDYHFWKDKAFLREMYPAVKRAVEGAYAWDADGDLIPDLTGTDQTFDSWDLSGCAVYTASLWLAALITAAKAAEILGDRPFAKKCGEDAKIVRANMIKKLWNGEYFILSVSDKKRDEGCLIDALSGDWFCRLMGLGGTIDDAMVRSHLKSVIKYNRVRHDPDYMYSYGTAGEEGYCYINGGYKDKRRICFQQYEPWTGMEYAFAVHCAAMGMTREALQVVKDVHGRKVKCGMVWNHVECGGDYFRPMVIGALWEMLKRRRR